LQCCNSDGIAARNAAVATALLLLQRCWCYALQHYCCNTVVAAHYDVAGAAASFCSDGVVAWQVATVMAVLL